MVHRKKKTKSLTILKLSQSLQPCKVQRITQRKILLCSHKLSKHKGISSICAVISQIHHLESNWCSRFLKWFPERHLLLKSLQVVKRKPEIFYNTFEESSKTWKLRSMRRHEWIFCSKANKKPKRIRENPYSSILKISSNQPTLWLSAWSSNRIAWNSISYDRSRRLFLAFKNNSNSLEN